MFLPLGDSPNPLQKPWVTWALIALNVVIHLSLLPFALRPASANDPTFQEYQGVLISEQRLAPGQQMPPMTEGDLLRYEHGFKPGRMSLSDLLTSMFLHGGFGHLLGNVLFLFIFGNNIEHRLGRIGFLLAYLGTGVAASFGDAFLRMGSSLPSIGASGAISGVLGLYFAWFPHNQVRIFVFLFPILMRTLELSAKWVLGAYLVLNNLLPALLGGGSGGVSYGAHIGGFLAGWALAKILGNTKRPSLAKTPATALHSPRTLSERFRAELGAGQLESASAMLFKLPRARTRTALSSADKARLGEALLAAGNGQAALATFQRTLADHPTDAHRVDAHLGAAKAQLALASPTAAYQHLYAAMEENPTPEQAAVARALLSDVRQHTRTVPSRFMAKLSET